MTVVQQGDGTPERCKHITHKKMTCVLPTLRMLDHVLALYIRVDVMKCSVKLEELFQLVPPMTGRAWRV